MRLAFSLDMQQWHLHDSIEHLDGSAVVATTESAPHCTAYRQQLYVAWRGHGNGQLNVAASERPLAAPHRLIVHHHAVRPM